jgi:hypothetical protein
VVIALGPWLIGAEWSLIDDPGHAAALQALSEQHGRLLASAQYAWQQASGDPAWGLFRPTYYVYASTVYHLPPAAVMSLRWLMIFVAAVGPAVFIWRTTRRLSVAAVTVLLIATSATLFLGAIYLSLQELTGIALVAAGLWVTRGWLRLLLWSLASMVKAPFSWVLLAWGVSELSFSKRRVIGIIAAVVGGGVLATNVILSRRGSYTQGYSFDFPYLLNSLVSLIGYPMALLLIAYIWWVATTRTTIRWNPYAAVFLFGGAAYAATLLPWRAYDYYTSPVFYLMAVGLALLLGPPTVSSRGRIMLGLAGPALLAAFVSGQAVWEVSKTHQTLTGVRDCLESLGPEARTYIAGPVLTTSESAGRYEQILELRNPDSDFTVAWVGEDWQGVADEPPFYFLRNKINSPSVDLFDVDLICDFPNAEIFQVRSMTPSR